MVLLNISGKVRGVDEFLVPTLIILAITLSVFIMAHPKTGTNIRCCLGPSFSGLDMVAFVTTLKRVFCSVSLTVNVVMACNSCFGGSRDVIGSAHRVRVFSATITFLTNLVVIPSIFICSNKSRTTLNRNPDLVFSALPGIFTNVRVNGFVNTTFFLLILFTTLADSISIVRTVITNVASGCGVREGETALLICTCALLLNVYYTFNFDV